MSFQPCPSALKTPPCRHREAVGVRRDLAFCGNASARLRRSNEDEKFEGSPK